jgi:hypothetical protein
MDALIAAHREGLALAAVAVIAGPDGTRIVTLANDSELGPGVFHRSALVVQACGGGRIRRRQRGAFFMPSAR